MTSSLSFTFLLLSFTSSLLLAASQSTPVASPSFPPTVAGTDCTTLLFGAADCLTYVEEGSNLTVPDKACCPELAMLVNTNPICLCELLKKGGNSLGIEIDVTRAMMLPSACKVQTPDPTLCSLINGAPTGAPTPSPTDGLPLPPSPPEAALPPSSVNNDNNAAAIGISATISVMALVATTAYSWNMF